MSKLVIYESVENHVAPTRAHEDDVGYDMAAYSIEYDRTHKYHTVDLGTRVALPGGYWAQIHARSSLADLGWRVASGVGIIDSGYRGPLKAKLEKRHENAKPLVAGESYVQLIIYPNPFVSMMKGKVSKDTSRGEGGFGSTTKKKVADEEEEEKEKKTSAPKKKKASKDEDDEEEEKKTSKKTSAKKKPPVESDDEEEKKTSKKTSAKKKPPVESDDEDDKKTSTSKKKKTPVVSDDEEDKKTSTSKKKKPPVVSDDEDDEKASKTSSKKTAGRGRSQ
jgi:dUTP pyrophosphatase